MEGGERVRVKVSAEGLESRPYVWPAAWKKLQLTTASREKCLQRNLKSADGSTDMGPINFMTVASCCSASVCLFYRHPSHTLTLYCLSSPILFLHVYWQLHRPWWYFNTAAHEFSKAAASSVPASFCDSDVLNVTALTNSDVQMVACDSPLPCI